MRVVVFNKLAMPLLHRYRVVFISSGFPPSDSHYRNARPSGSISQKKHTFIVMTYFSRDPVKNIFLPGTYFSEARRCLVEIFLKCPAKVLLTGKSILTGDVFQIFVGERNRMCRPCYTSYSHIRRQVITSLLTKNPLEMPTAISASVADSLHPERFVIQIFFDPWKNIFNHVRYDFIIRHRKLLVRGRLCHIFFQCKSLSAV